MLLALGIVQAAAAGLAILLGCGKWAATQSSGRQTPLLAVQLSADGGRPVAIID